MKWKWLNSSGRARSQTASSQIPEVWELGSPQHVLFNKHPHTWPFAPAAPSLPQRLELSTLALAPWSLGSAFPFQVDLGWVPHMVILFVRVENLGTDFCTWPLCRAFQYLRHMQTPAGMEHEQKRLLTRNLCWLTWIGLCNPAAKSTVRKAGAESDLKSSLGLLALMGKLGSHWHPQYVHYPPPCRAKLWQGVFNH